MTGTQLDDRGRISQRVAPAPDPPVLAVAVRGTVQAPSLTREEVRAGLVEVKRRCQESEARRTRVRSSRRCLMIAMIFVGLMLGRIIGWNSPEATASPKRTTVRMSGSGAAPLITPPPVTAPPPAAAYPLSTAVNTRSAPMVSQTEGSTKLTGPEEVVCYGEGGAARRYPGGPASSIWYKLRSGRWVSATVVELRPAGTPMARCPDY